jgi:hypothetical protein
MEVRVLGLDVANLEKVSNGERNLLLVLAMNYHLNKPPKLLN